MKTTLTQSDFLRAFKDYSRYDQFGYTALCSLFDYLEQIEEDNGEEIEMDVVALCCDYCVNDVATIATDYGIDVTDMDGDEMRYVVLKYLNDNTTVVDEDCDGQILYCSVF